MKKTLQQAVQRDVVMHITGHRAARIAASVLEYPQEKENNKRKCH
jgi:hypothetical protein